MPNGAWGKVMWENNQDTPINFSNLSRSIDIISESKFMYYDDSDSSYELWADVVINEPWPSGQGIANFVGKYVYNKFNNLNQVKYGLKSDDPTPIYSWEDKISPYKKIILVKPNGKFGLSYMNIIENQLNYKNFDLGVEDQVISIESLLLDDDYKTNTNYYIYLYHYSTYGDNISLKIIDQDDDTEDAEWKIGGDDISSPTGKRVIAIRKVGGFKTDQNAQIIKSSVWDISTRNEEIVSEKYRIISPITEEIKDLTAIDINLDLASNNYASNNVDGALIESKTILDLLRNDVYTTNERFGIDLRFSPVKKTGNLLSPIEQNQNEVSLVITQGYIDVLGTRVKIEEDIYLGDNINNTKTPISINGYEQIISVSLGQEHIVNNHSYNLDEGLWRCFINTSGSISFIEDNVERAMYRPELIGWYNSNGERCIAKFKVGYNVNHFYIHKMSVTGTYDSNIPINTMIIYHGTMCPDGMVPADGRWHDINGRDKNTYAIMPEINPTSAWQSGRWYEDTPNLWDRTTKMIGETSLPYDIPEFEIDINTNNVIGSSYDTGEQNLITSNEHNHDYIHQHDTGNINIISTSGSHTHEQNDFIWQWIEGAGQEQIVQDAQTGIKVADAGHKHILITTASGTHGHSTADFNGKTGDPDPINTSKSSSWAPYKEILYCIKK